MSLEKREALNVRKGGKRSATGKFLEKKDFELGLRQRGTGTERGRRERRGVPGRSRRG